MDYMQKQVQIRDTYLKSCLEIELEKSRDLKTEIKNVKDEVEETKKRNINLLENRNKKRLEECYWGETKFSHVSTAVDETIKQMEEHLTFVKAQKADYHQQLETITNGYKKGAAVIEEGGKILNVESIQSNIHEIESNIQLKKGEITERQSNLERARAEWAAPIKEMNDLYDLLCQLEGEQNKQLTDDSQPTVNSREDDSVSSTSKKTDAGTDELSAIIEMLRSQKKEIEMSGMYP